MRAQKQPKKSSKLSLDDGHILSADSPFAVQEAYKTLRTNVIFSLPEEKCKRIIITSSMQAEAKSTTAVNLGIAFAQNHSRVLLMDCDLRLPTDAAKLGLHDTPGLSNVLVGMNTIDECIFHLPNGLDLLPAGDIPPNPTELLGSERMRKLLELLGNRYEYILMDMPPVCTVADAMILSKQASGVLLIARQNVSSKESISEAVRQLEFSGAKILGFVFTGVANEKYRNYKKGGYGYGYGYAAPPKNAKKGQ